LIRVIRDRLGSVKRFLVQNIFSLPAFQQAERFRALFEFLDDSEQLEKENPALVAKRDRAVVELSEERPAARVWTSL
jgi:hypothetical protein